VAALLYGLILGYITFRLLASIDNYQVEVMLTLAAVMGGYLLAKQAACLWPTGDGGRRTRGG
jgi:NhaP-type Na+/H+ or K+/H+ antiporter